MPSIPTTGYLIDHVRIIDGNSADAFVGSVLVREDRIEKVWTLAGREAAYAAHVIDGRGATLLPGLIESHSHLTFTDYVRSVEMGFLPVEEHLLITLRNARKMLSMGFTSCFSAASAKPRLDVVLRNAIDAGEFPGPRTLAASPEMTVTAGLGDVRLPHMYRENFAAVLDGADAFRQYARQMCRDGVDTLKMNISGDAGTPASPSHTTVMTEAEVAAVCEVGRAHGKRLAAHTRSAQSVKLALRHGVDVLYHATLLDEQALDLLEAARDRVYVAPTLGALKATLDHAGQWGVTFSDRQRQDMESELSRGIDSMKALIRRGVTVLPGGDYGTAWNPIGANARDIALFVELLGLSPMVAIQSATRDGARLMGTGDCLGQVRPGFIADLLLVEGDPLQDISILSRPECIRHVIKGGKLAPSKNA